VWSPQPIWTMWRGEKSLVSVGKRSGISKAFRNSDGLCKQTSCVVSDSSEIMRGPL